MGVSFKILKTGKRFRPKPPPQLSSPAQEPAEKTNGEIASKHETDITKAVEMINHYLVSSTNGAQCLSTEHEVSFTLNLLPDGFFIGKPNEVAKAHKFIQEAPKLLHSYTRASEAMFSAIESGWLPGDILDDIPSKYINGTLLCEVHDYRKCPVDQGSNPSVDGVPDITKVLLRMSLENIVKDIPTISDDNWTYSDLMEVESRILKAIQPKLCLDPTPMLDRLCSDPISLKLNLNMYGGKRKRPQSVTDVMVTSNSQTNGKKVSIDRTPENASHETADFRNNVNDVPGPRVYDNMSIPHVSSGMQLLQSKNEASMPALNSSSQTTQFQTSVKHIRINQDDFPMTRAPNAQASVQQNVVSTYSENVNNRIPHGKRDNQDMQQPDISNLKRSRQTPILQEGNQFAGLQGDGHIRADTHLKSAFLQQIDAKGLQFSGNIPEQKYFSPVMNDIANPNAGGCFYQNQQGVKLGIKLEQMETDRLDRQNFEKMRNVLHTVDAEALPMESQQLQPQHTRQSFGKTQFQSQQQWHSSIFASERDSRKDDMLPKRRMTQSPRVSAGPSIQSTVSSKSAEHSTGSFGGQFGTFSAITVGAPTGSQKEKAVPHSNAAGTPVTSSPSDSLQRQAKRKTNSIPKAHNISGVASPASVSNVSASPNSGSPSVATAPGGELVLLERFSKIDTLTQRFKLAAKKKKVENANPNVPRQVTHKPQELPFLLSSSLNTEDVTDSEWPMSKSLMGGTVNNYKIRILNCVRPSVYQGSGVSVPARTCYRLVLTEKPNDGTVIMQYGDMDESDNPLQDCLLILPNTHCADLLAAQFRLLMERDGYQVIDDQIRPNPARMGMVASPSCDNAVPQGHPLDGIPSSQSNNPALINDNMNHLNSVQNFSSIRMLPPGQAYALSVPQGYLAGGGNPTASARAQIDQTMLKQQQQLPNQQSQMQQQLQTQQQLQQQLQHPQMQRSSSMLHMSPISQLMGQSSMQIPGNQMVSKPTHLQLQALQQQAQQQQAQQQQAQFPRKVGVMGLGSMGNMMGLGGLSNVMGVGGVRGISSSMSAVPGLNNINPNQINLGSAANFGVGLRPGSLSPVHAATIASKLRMVAQNRGNLFGAQSNITGLPGNNSQMLPSSVGLSMLGQSLSRTNIDSLQRTAMAPMGPPKIPGANIYMNQQLHLQQQQLQQQQQQQMLQQQHQQISSPSQLPHVSSPSVMVSSQAITQHQQQQISPQHMSQEEIAMSPQQLSAGTMQQINNGGGAGPGPTSPQLSSQTHGSVGSISSSPLEQLQAPNKGGGPGNT